MSGFTDYDYERVKSALIEQFPGDGMAITKVPEGRGQSAMRLMFNEPHLNDDGSAPEKRVQEVTQNVGLWNARTRANGSQILVF